MPRILLIRHGQSVWNAIGRWQGHADAPLSELGIMQARDAGPRLVECGVFAGVFASDLRRARTTAEILAGLVGIGTVQVDQGLRERDVGEWTGLNRDEIRTRFPGALPEDLSTSFATVAPPPGWESSEALHARASAALGRAAATVGADDQLLVVSHGGVVYTFEESAGIERRRVANLSGIWLDVAEAAITVGDRVDLAPVDERTSTPKYQA